MAFSLDLIKGNGAIVDSAPILASLNFAKANVKPEINLERVSEFFKSVDISPAIRVLHILRKTKYSPESFVRFFMFEKLGGFVSRAQALRFVKENLEVANILGFPSGQVPGQASFTYFMKKHGSVPQLLTPTVDATTEFFENCEATPEDTDIDFFFWSF